MTRVSAWLAYAYGVIRGQKSSLTSSTMELPYARGWQNRVPWIYAAHSQTSTWTPLSRAMSINGALLLRLLLLLLHLRAVVVSDNTQHCLGLARPLARLAARQQTLANYWCWSYFWISQAARCFVSVASTFEGNKFHTTAAVATVAARQQPFTACKLRQ